ncbi:MAG: hypothetical protein KQH53_06555 [Desulfarculaceae bacterium]|nr:hypothetical protein [Desulfarculaceae bacterium]
MNPLRAIFAALAWIGRQGTRSITALVIVGIAVPPLGALFKPFLSAAVFVLLCTAFLRLDPNRLRGYLGKPRLVILATVWTMLVMPLGFGLACWAFGLDQRLPALYLGLMMQAVASPMMASPALAALMGLDATLVLITLVASSALIPITAPLFAHFFMDASLALDPLALGLKLALILAGSALVGTLLRRLAGPVAIARHGEKIDGFNVLALFVFVAAIMQNVAGSFVDKPLLSSGLTVLAFGAFFLLLASTAAAFLWAGRDRALALGLMSAQRNLGLMLAATGGALPELTWLYFALAQFPIYLTPQMLLPLARKLTRKES